MAHKPARVCSCGTVVRSGMTCSCADKRKAEADRRRPNAAARGYDAEWRELRARFLLAHPCCSVVGCERHATAVDHVQSVRDRPDLRLAWSNLRPMCKAHHDQRTARDQGFARRQGGGSQFRPEGG